MKILRNLLENISVMRIQPCDLLVLNLALMLFFFGFQLEYIFETLRCLILKRDADFRRSRRFLQLYTELSVHFLNTLMSNNGYLG